MFADGIVAGALPFAGSGSVEVLSRNFTRDGRKSRSLGLCLYRKMKTASTRMIHGRIGQSGDHAHLVRSSQRMLAMLLVNAASNLTTKPNVQSRIFAMPDSSWPPKREPKSKSLNGWEPLITNPDRAIRDDKYKSLVPTRILRGLAPEWADDEPTSADGRVSTGMTLSEPVLPGSEWLNFAGLPPRGRNDIEEK